MLAIRCLVAVALVAAFASPVIAQVKGNGHVRKDGTYTGELDTKRTPLGGCGNASDYSRLSELASESYTRPSFDIGACHYSRGAMYARRVAQMQQRRDAEQERREKSRAALPVKFWDDEELAKVRYDLAHKLYKKGNPEASKRWLEKLVKDYSATQTADRARDTLARFDPGREPVNLVAAISRR
jgi:hypothetical protein